MPQIKTCELKMNLIPKSVSNKNCSPNSICWNKDWADFFRKSPFFFTSYTICKVKINWSVAKVAHSFECATINLNPECYLVQRPIIKLSAIATKNTWLMRIITNQLKYSARELKCTSTIVYEFLFVQSYCEK